MANAYRMTRDGKLDRRLLRVCAVYRATKRWGMDREWAIAKLAEKIPRQMAVSIYQIWPHT